MNRKCWRIAIMGIGVVLTLTPACLFAQTAEKSGKSETNWPSFRGVRASGVADGFATPTKWDAEKNENVLWKTPIPGLGHSSPVVWGDRVFVTTAISGKPKAELKVGLYGDITPVEDDTVQQWKVYCVNKKTGKIEWERTAREGVPKIKRHPKSTNANPTMTTDGKNVLAFFGSEGLYCYDMQGNLIWKKDLGLLDSGYYEVPDAQWGFASSPVLFEDKVIVQCDVQQNSFLGAFSLKDGSEIWRTKRGDVPTWGTPTIFPGDKENGAQIIVNGWKQIGGYDAATGKSLWKMRGGGDIPVPTPIIAGNLVYITNAHGRMAPLYAVKLFDASGDISLIGDATTSPNIAWAALRGGAYMQTPLVYGDYLYLCRDNGILFCYDAKTGKPIYQERLGTGRSGFTASGVAGDGKLYYSSEDGDIYVVRAGPKFEILATNPMGEICMATPALSEGVIFFRTQSHLIAIRDKAKK